MEAATVKLSVSSWTELKEDFGTWLMPAFVVVILLGLVLGHACVRCLRTRHAAESSDSTMQEILKQNLARSLAPAQVQAWVDAMSPITGTVDDSMVRMHSKLEEVAARILETMGIQVRDLGEKQLAEVRAQFTQMMDALSDIAKLTQLQQPLSDLLESVKAQVKGSWSLDPEKIDDQFKTVVAKVNGIGALVNGLVKRRRKPCKPLIVLDLERSRPALMKRPPK